MEVIAIDGVAGSGKGTLAKELAKRLGYIGVNGLCVHTERTNFKKNILFRN